MLTSVIRNRIPFTVIGIFTVIVGALCAAQLMQAAAAPPGHDRVVFATTLPNVPGKTITAVKVDYPPGVSSPAHRHAGSVFAYVLSGEIRSENSATGPARVYHAGEAFFEPPGSAHLVSENASASEPASLLAVFVADDDAKLTVPAR